MPNNYSQAVRLKHNSPRVMKHFVQWLTDQRMKVGKGETKRVYGLFHYFRPMPQEIQDTDGTPGVSPPWYEWAVKNWGSKWDAYEIDFLFNPGLGDDHDAVWLTFASAWCPPKALWEYISDLGWEIMAMGHNDGTGWFYSNHQTINIELEHEQ